MGKQFEGLSSWAAGKGDEGIHTYWKERNQTTLDGLPTDSLDGTE